MKLIVVVDENYAIGKDNKLLCHISSDLKRFKKITTGGVVVLGRKTLESFPNSKPLPNREHIVLSKNENYTIDNDMVTMCNDINNLQKILDEKENKNVFVIGGAEIYKQLLPYCTMAYVTKIHQKFDADAFFPNLDKLSNWEISYESDIQIENGISFSYVDYINKDFI